MNDLAVKHFRNALVEEHKNVVAVPDGVIMPDIRRVVYSHFVLMLTFESARAVIVGKTGHDLVHNDVYSKHRLPAFRSEIMPRAVPESGMHAVIFDNVPNILQVIVPVPFFDPLGEVT